MVWTRLCAALAAALVALAAPVSVPAAPEGKVVIAQGVDPSSLDAMNQQETPASVVATHIYDTLVERDQSLKVVPALATELPKLLAPTVWEIKLRKGVKFHNGEDFNADSVKYSLERVKEPSMRGSSNFKPIDRVEIVDPYTVKVHTTKPWPIYVVALTQRQASMYPPRPTRARTRPSSRRIPSAPGPTVSCAGARTRRSSSRRGRSTGGERRRSRTWSSGPFPTTPCAWPPCRTARWTWP